GGRALTSNILSRRLILLARLFSVSSRLAKRRIAIGQISQREGFDGSIVLVLDFNRDVEPKEIRAEEGGTPPSGQPIIEFPTGRNLFFVATRHFVPGLRRDQSSRYHHLVPSSFVVLNHTGQIGTRSRPYLSTFSKPHHLSRTTTRTSTKSTRTI